MKFARSVWKVLVAIKDGLVLLLLLLFFAGLYGLLALRPTPGSVQTGALYIALNGPAARRPSPCRSVILSARWKRRRVMPASRRSCSISKALAAAARLR